MRKAKHPAIFWLFLAPVLFAFVMVIVVPFVLGVYYSFTSWSATARIGDGLRFIGIGNYAKILKDPTFAYSFMLTVGYTVLNMIAINVVSFGLAILVTRSHQGPNVYRAGFFVPNLIGGLILGYVWQFIFNNAIPPWARCSASRPGRTRTTSCSPRAPPPSSAWSSSEPGNTPATSW